MLTLREDLDLSESAQSEEGSRVWLLQDAVNNKFFKLGAIEVRMLSELKNLTIDTGKLDELAQTLSRLVGLPSTQASVEKFLVFLRQNNLLTASGIEAREALIRQRELLAPGVFKKVLRNYLFMRFHILNPNKLLDILLPYVGWVFRPGFWLLIILNTFFAIYLTSRQFDYFVSSFVGYFNFEGFVIAGLAIVFAKILHELGHAIVARHYGCSINSMGFALLIFWPVLFTDTTDAWKLKEPRQRALIGVSGVLVELVIASVCLTLWNFTDEGVLKSAFFILATTTWLLTLAVNLNPLMRFDGYFVLSDLLGIENLQERSFALARWQLREFLFGYGFPAPERRRTDLVVFAFATWVYRFLLYLGIALIIYNYFFKLLGIVLVAVQLFNSLVKPLMRELKFWWQNKARAKGFPNTSVSFVLLAGLLLWMLIPVKRDISLPAFVHTTDGHLVYAQQAGRLSWMIKAEATRVDEGDVLAVMEFPDIQYQLHQLQRDMKLIEVRIAGLGVGASKDFSRAALLAQLRSAKEQQRQLLSKLQDREIKAPFAGIVRGINPGLSIGQWLGAGETLMSLQNPNRLEVVAYISEQDYQRVSLGQTASFYSAGGELPRIDLLLELREDFPVKALEQLYVASSLGGELPVRDGIDGALAPQKSTYRLYFHAAHTDLSRVLVGTVIIDAEAVSTITLYWRKLVNLWRQESGF